MSNEGLALGEKESRPNRMVKSMYINSIVDITSAIETITNEKVIVVCASHSEGTCAVIVGGSNE